MWTKKFWIDAAERVIATFAQVVLAIVGVAWLQDPSQLTQAPWLAILAAGVLGAFLSLMKCLAASFKGDSLSASLVK